MLPIHLDLGFKQIYFYEGIYFLISIVIGVYFIYRTVKAYGGRVDKFEGLVVWSIVGALLGARLSHYMFWESEAFFQNPAIFFSPTGAGNSITGGLVGGMLGGLLFVRRNKLNYWEYFSFVSPGLLLGQALGRIGCFINGDAYGTATSSVFGMHFPRFATIIPSFETEYRISSPAWQYSFNEGLVEQASTISAALHPTQLYEMFGDFVILAIIVWYFLKYFESNRKSPVIFMIHTGGYAFLRFALEYLRADNEGVTMFNMTTLQLTLLAYSVFTAIYAIRYLAANKIKTTHG